ncbi:hypothetical protein BLD44_008320 [Mastigocladus laminosus UU774]|nr:hypothetical protein B4U84_04435 [Westiellopsis prolifica IICB1]TFI54664.1 hypothetical protein BLD44_008320 [Mastigocladus laminosus UU774]
MRDSFNRMMGKTRYVVCRFFLHLQGQEVAPLLGLYNRNARQAIDADGDLEILGEGLLEICQTLLQYEEYWRSSHYEGGFFWDEGEAGDYYNDLFTDSAERYLSELDLNNPYSEDEPLTLPVTRNVVFMITVAFEGEAPDLETDLYDINSIKAGLKALIDLHNQGKLRDVQIHCSPARLGDELTSDQLLQFYPELVPL